MMFLEAYNSIARKNLFKFSIYQYHNNNLQSKVLDIVLIEKKNKTMNGYRTFLKYKKSFVFEKYMIKNFKNNNLNKCIVNNYNE